MSQTEATNKKEHEINKENKAGKDFRDRDHMQDNTQEKIDETRKVTEHLHAH